MKNSKLNLVVLALGALTASSFAQFGGPTPWQRQEAQRHPEYRQDTSRNSQSLRSYDATIRELENAIKKLRCALPIYQGRRADALKDTMQILDQLREPDRSWSGNYLSRNDREDYRTTRQYRDYEVRQSNSDLQEAARSLKCAIELLDKMSSRYDRRIDRMVDGLEDAQRDIKLALVQTERSRSHDQKDGHRDDPRDERRDDIGRGSLRDGYTSGRRG